MAWHGPRGDCGCCGCTLLDIDGDERGFTDRQPRTPQEQINLYSLDPTKLTFVANYFGTDYGAFLLASGETWTGEPTLPLSNFFVRMDSFGRSELSSDTLGEMDIRVRLTEVVESGSPDVYEYRMYRQLVNGNYIRRLWLQSTAGDDIRSFESPEHGWQYNTIYASDWTIASSDERCWLGEPPTDLDFRFDANANATFRANPYIEYLSNGLKVPKRYDREFKLSVENLSPFGIRFRRLTVEKFRQFSFDYSDGGFYYDPGTFTLVTQNGSCLDPALTHISSPRAEPKPINTTISGIGTANAFLDHRDSFETAYAAVQRPSVSTTTGSTTVVDIDTFYSTLGWAFTIGHVSEITFQFNDTMTDGTPAISIRVQVRLKYYSTRVFASYNADGSGTSLSEIFPVSSLGAPRYYRSFPGEILTSDAPAFPGLGDTFTGTTQSTFVWFLKIPASVAGTAFSFDLSTSDYAGLVRDGLEITSVEFDSLPFDYSTAVSASEDFDADTSLHIQIISASTNATVSGFTVSLEVDASIYA